MPTYPVPSYSSEEVNDAMLAGYAALERDMATIIKAWQGNRGTNQTRELVSTLPAEVKEAMKQAEPAGYEELMKQLRVRR